ncbi:MAG: ATP-binding protein [Fidelibacterota bacterium]
MINRQIYQTLMTNKWSKKTIVILGPRQTGKTTLMKQIAQETGSHLWLNCDDPNIRINLELKSVEQIRVILGEHKRVFIDEIQRVKNSGLLLKLIHDTFPDINVMVSGSSALEISSNINEPLTGRKLEYMLYPISWNELTNDIGYLSAKGQLEQRLIYGMYPDVINHPGNENEILTQLASSFLYKDILSYKGLRKPELLEKLLQALALQIGNEVSFSELGRLLEVDKKTVMNYLDLLEKAFIVYRLKPFARNIRNEINTKRKVYFFDNGIRNAILAAYQPLALRLDVGALWENFILGERRKQIAYKQKWSNCFYWRTTQQQEIDYIEERDGLLHAFEFKWNPTKNVRFPKTFMNEYDIGTSQIITPDNMDDFLK